MACRIIDIWLLEISSRKCQCQEIEFMLGFVWMSFVKHSMKYKPFVQTCWIQLGLWQCQIVTAIWWRIEESVGGNSSKHHHWSILLWGRKRGRKKDTKLFQFSIKISFKSPLIFQYLQRAPSHFCSRHLFPVTTLATISPLQRLMRHVFVGKFPLIELNPSRGRHRLQLEMSLTYQSFNNFCPETAEREGDSEINGEKAFDIISRAIEHHLKQMLDINQFEN